jgi:AraC family transcriptional regulator
MGETGGCVGCNGVCISPSGSVRRKIVSWGSLKCDSIQLTAVRISIQGDLPSIDHLAEIAGLSPFHFSRAFKESFGRPPHRYQTWRRIEKAKELLAQCATSVTAIGVKLGFSDTSSFSTTFHKHTGTTPTAYRRGLE